MENVTKFNVFNSDITCQNIEQFWVIINAMKVLLSLSKTVMMWITVNIIGPACSISSNDLYLKCQVFLAMTCFLKSQVVLDNPNLVGEGGGGDNGMRGGDCHIFPWT